MSSMWILITQRLLSCAVWSHMKRRGGPQLPRSPSSCTAVGALGGRADTVTSSRCKASVKKWKLEKARGAALTLLTRKEADFPFLNHSVLFAFSSNKKKKTWSFCERVFLSSWSGRSANLPCLFTPPLPYPLINLPLRSLIAHV